MLTVPVYEVNREAEEEKVGEYRLVNGRIEISPARDLVLRRIMERFPPTLEPTPEVWLRTLCQKLHGTYLYAGPAREV